MLRLGLGLSALLVVGLLIEFARHEVKRTPEGIIYLTLYALIGLAAIWVVVGLMSLVRRFR